MREKMILDNIGLIHKVMKDNNYNCISKEDFEEASYVCLLGLIRGVDTLDGSRNPSTYLYVCIKRALTNLFARRTMAKRQGLEVPLDIQYFEAIPSNDNVEKEVILKDEIERMLKALDNLKSEKQKDIIKKYYGIGCYNKNANQISLEEKTTFQNICCIRDAGLRNLRKALKEEE